jgi:hypothetical protein
VAAVGGTLLAIAGWVGLGLVLLAALWAVCWLFSAERPRPQLLIFGDYPFVHAEMKTAGGEGSPGGKGKTEQAARRDANNDIAHRGEGL